MNDAFRQEFAIFTKNKLHPAVAGIALRKRSGIIKGIIAGGICFLIGVAVAYAFLAPYREAMQKGNIMLWPMLVLAPMALGVLVFSLVFVLSLKKTVVDFRNALMGGLAEFIEANLTCDSDTPLARDKVEASHLFTGNGDIAIGPERFKGYAGDARVEFSEIGVKGDAGEGGAMKGLYMSAQYDRPFPYPFFIFPAKASVSISGLQKALSCNGYETPDGLVRVDRGERQFLLPSGVESGADWIGSHELAKKLDEVKIVNGGELYLAARDNDMSMALLSPGTDKNTVGIFDRFDLDKCREFCRDARLALRIAKKCGERQGIIAKNSLS